MSRREARTDFEARLGRRSDQSAEQVTAGALPPPDDVVVEEGVGQVTLRWSPVDGAVGYLVQRTDDGDGALRPVDHGGRDVLAVPGHHYVDTTGRPGAAYRYAVAALPDVERGPGAPSMTVRGLSLPVAGEPPVVEVVVRSGEPAGAVRRLWHMSGSERLSQLLIDERTGGRDIAAEFAAALRLGTRVVVLDYDPQCNLSSIFLNEDELFELWESNEEERLVVSFPVPVGATEGILLVCVNGSQGREFCKFTVRAVSL